MDETRDGVAIITVNEVGAGKEYFKTEKRDLYIVSFVAGNE